MVELYGYGGNREMLTGSYNCLSTLRRNSRPNVYVSKEFRGV